MRFRRPAGTLSRWVRVPQAAAALLLLAVWVSVSGWHISHQCHDDWSQFSVGDRNVVCAGPAWHSPTRNADGLSAYLMTTGAVVTLATLVTIGVAVARPDGRVAVYAGTWRLLWVGGLLMAAAAMVFTVVPVILAGMALKITWRNAGRTGQAVRVGKTRRLLEDDPQQPA